MLRSWFNRVVLSGFICMLAVPAWAAADPGTVKILDDMKTTFGWQTMTDQTATKDLKLTEGPKPGAKAIQLSFDFKDSKWIALIKEAAFTLGADDGIRFLYNGSGASVSLWVKIYDAYGNAAGYFMPTGTLTSGWQEAVIPPPAFEFLWGPSPTKSVNLNSLTKLEFTLDLDERGGTTYTLNPSIPGQISFAKIEVVNTSVVKPSAKTAAVAAEIVQKITPKKLKSGSFLIDDLSNPTGWRTASDQDGKCELTSVKDSIERSQVRALKAEYQFGAKGVWNALMKGVVLDLSKMQSLGFYAKYEGAPSKLVLKLTDSNKRVYGYALSPAAITKHWKRLAIGRKSLEFLYSEGEQNQAPLNFAEIQKIELTIEKPEESTSTGGSLFLSGLTYR
jgi:hypothetical protein